MLAVRVRNGSRGSPDVDFYGIYERLLLCRGPRRAGVVPYFGDDERGTKVSDIYDREAHGLFNVDTLQKKRIVGPEYQDVYTNREIDESLELLYKRLQERGADFIRCWLM